jgi:hypothetical protein
VTGVVVVVAAVLVDVLSVDVLSVVCVAVVVSEDVDVGSVDDVAVVSVAVDVLSVEPPSRRVIPNAPEASAPAPNNAANARTTPAHLSALRRFVPSAPLLPQIRRAMESLSVKAGRASPSRALP